ncbi:MAG: hypothetical protein IKQ39_03075 [Oscillospiraceae bacterium]|nr:hypothetical protein [Oscillospiraceae bacterium]
MTKHTGEYIAAFLFGFFAYCLFEIALRGRTHWTMGLLGGISLALLYSMEHRLDAPRTVRALLGALFVTAAEFTVGVFDNLIMGWQVWDYSDRPFNLLGQICPLFTVVWFVLCLFGLHFCKLLRRQYQPRSD